MPHNPALECVIPRDSSRGSAPPPPLPPQPLGIVGWVACQENVGPTTHSPLAEVGFASFAPSPTFPKASSTGFPGLASMQTYSPADVISSFGNIEGCAGIIARPTHMLSGCTCPQSQTSQDHNAVPGMSGSSSVDGGRHNDSESRGRLESDLADDVLAAAAAAAVEEPQPQNLKFGDLDVDFIDLNAAVFYFWCSIRRGQPAPAFQL
ncbi:hypothetical protein BDDG_12395 [Blastomyces dermatitidis ATCC 18188]|nr:hypothetical protein BDDG_12395 [Blastomyces dermatitidis ATCC 18188]